MNNVVFNKKASNGQQITVEYNDSEFYSLTVKLDGETIGKSEIDRCKPQGDVTHYIGTKPAIGLTDADVATIKSAIAELRDNDPREKRNDILRKMANATSEMHYYRNKDDNGTGLRYADVKKHEAAWEAAREELAQFDLAHPALRAEIDAERAEATERAHRFVENN